MLSVLALSFALVGCLAAPSDAEFRLGREGEIMAWLVAGPFPNAGALQLKGRGFASDYLTPESAANPAELDVIAASEIEKSYKPEEIVARKPDWRLFETDVHGLLDLDRALNGSKPGIAYCFANLVSPNDADVQLWFGSDDGAKVWVNGRQVFQIQKARGVTRDEDKVPIHLSKGVNRLLFKIEQGDGGWGLQVRVVAGSGKRVEGVTERLRIAQTGPTAKLARVAAGKPGSLDLQASAELQNLILTASRFAKNMRGDIADPLSLDKAVEAARNSALVDAAVSADAMSHALQNGRDELATAYREARAPIVAKTQKDLPLTSIPIAGQHLVKVLPGGRYFEVDGRPFLPLGYNHNPDWSKFVEANPSRDDYHPEVTEAYMAHLAESGVNTLRMMIETPPSGNLEEPLGTFSPEHVKWIDTIVSAARKHGIRLIITPWDTFWMNRRWETTAYNPHLGGLVKRRIDFITDLRVREQQKRRLRFMIDRWGNLDTIFSWEILNEGDIWWGANAAQLDAWATDIAEYVRSYEKQKWGWNHLISFSFADPMPKGDLANFAYRSKLFGYATTHLYIGESKAPTEPVAPARTTAQGVRYALSQISDNRPYIDTENGPIDTWITDPKLDAEVFHNMSWAHLASGGAGSGFRWPYRHPHILSEEMLQTLRSMKPFVDRVDWRLLTGPHIEIVAEGAAQGATCAIATKKAALAWTSAGDEISVSGFGSAHGVLAYDCQKGTWSSQSSVETSGAKTSVRLPYAGSWAVFLTK
jgi:mannan endo-1,4-beta-mannosidase